MIKEKKEQRVETIEGDERQANIILKKLKEYTRHNPSLIK
jgi:hypothetical protein